MEISCTNTLFSRNIVSINGVLLYPWEKAEERWSNKIKQKPDGATRIGNLWMNPGHKQGLTRISCLLKNRLLWCCCGVVVVLLLLLLLLRTSQSLQTCAIFYEPIFSLKPITLFMNLKRYVATVYLLYRSQAKKKFPKSWKKIMRTLETKENVCVCAWVRRGVFQF